MNLFRSEDHARRWSGFKPESEGGLVTLRQLASIMGTPRHRDRLNGRYVSSFPTYGPPFFENLKQVTGNHPFWDPTPR
jgi:hypothetical protein